MLFRLSSCILSIMYKQNNIGIRMKGGLIQFEARRVIHFIYAIWKSSTQTFEF